MKILIAVDTFHPDINGVSLTYQHTYQALKALGHDVTLLTPSSFKRTYRASSKDCTFAFPRRNEIDLLTYNNHKIIIATPEGPIGRYVRKNAPAHYITCYHTEWPLYLKKWYRLPLWITHKYIRSIHQRSQCILTPSKSCAKALKKIIGQNNVHVWGNGNDNTLFFPQNNTSKKNHEKILLYVGRVSDEKNITAFLDLHLDFPHQKKVVGTGKDMAHYQRRYPDVVFEGKIPHEQLSAFYHQADVLVFPSRTDTLGLVILESIQCGTPVAAYPVQGPLDTIKQHQTGVMDNDLETAIQQALQIDRNQMKSYIKGHSWQDASRQLIQYIEQYLS